jgi:hypothetical protein
VHFHEVDGRLIRQWVPAQRRQTMEIWMGDGWAPYSDVEHVARYGRRVSYVEAIALLHDARDLHGAVRRFSDDEARAALSDRRLRAPSSVHR